jgi:tRNA G18 (ribose-2'-O)-methylase SpoU
MNKKTPISELKRWSPEELINLEKSPLTIVLDNVRSAQNVGSIFRTADAFRCKEIILCGITAVPPHREINKTAIGATESVKWSYFDKTLAACQKLRDTGIGVYTVEQTEKSILLNDFQWPENQEIALVFGNEVEGVDQTVVDFCSASIEIPQFGLKHSLNISVSAGVVIWDLFSRFCMSRIVQS